MDVIYAYCCTQEGHGHNRIVSEEATKSATASLKVCRGKRVHRVPNPRLCGPAAAPSLAGASYPSAGPGASPVIVTTPQPADALGDGKQDRHQMLPGRGLREVFHVGTVTTRTDISSPAADAEEHESGSAASCWS